MKKTILLLVGLIAFHCVFTQEKKLCATGKICFAGIGVERQYINNDGEIESKKIVGKDPVLIYDSFFGNWVIMWIGENEKFFSFDLTNYDDNLKGLMVDNGGYTWLMIDTIEKNGWMYLVGMDEKKNDWWWYIYGLKKID